MKKILSILLLVCCSFGADLIGWESIESKCEQKDKSSCEILENFNNNVKLCQNKNVDACNMVASLTDTLYNGVVNADKSRAYGLYDMACFYGSSRACYKAYMMARMGDGVEQDQFWADIFMWTDCQNGNADSCNIVKSSGFDIKKFVELRDAYNEGEQAGQQVLAGFAKNSFNGELALKAINLFNKACNDGEWTKACVAKAQTLVISGFGYSSIDNAEAKKLGAESKKLGKEMLETYCKYNSRTACNLLENFKSLKIF